jgi:hypothetical protein
LAGVQIETARPAGSVLPAGVDPISRFLNDHAQPLALFSTLLRGQPALTPGIGPHPVKPGRAIDGPAAAHFRFVTGTAVDAFLPDHFEWSASREAKRCQLSWGHRPRVAPNCAVLTAIPLLVWFQGPSAISRAVIAIVTHLALRVSQMNGDWHWASQPP